MPELMYSAFLPHVQALLRREKPAVTFVDIGSRNGLWELPELAAYTDAFGFEPNPEEFRKLKLAEESTPFVIKGRRMPPYHSLHFFPYALGNRNGKEKFYLTPNTTASGLLEPNLERLREIVWKGRAYGENFAREYFEDYKTIDVDVRTLDSLAGEQHLPPIDYLKIDVEGSEYEVFEGAQNILPEVGVIKVETCFIPFRKGQKLFSHVDLLLRDFGFDLLCYEVDRVQIGYKERTKPVEYIPFDRIFSDPYGQPLSTDAIYVNRTLMDPERSLVQALVLLSKKYVDEALHIFRTKADMRDAAFLELLRTYEDSRPLHVLKTFRKDKGEAGPRFRRAGYKIVDDSIALLGRVLHFFRR